MTWAGRRVQNVWDYREKARRRLPRAFFEFLDRGTEDELALTNNRAALERIKFRPRALVDVSHRDISTTLFGTPRPSPIARPATTALAIASIGAPQVNDG